jgi:hypothetical protein
LINPFQQTHSVTRAEQQKDSQNCEQGSNTFEQGERFVENNNRQHRRDYETKPENRRVDADRPGRQALEEIKEANKHEYASTPVPYDCELDRQRAGDPNVRNDQHEENQRLATNEVHRFCAGAGRPLIDKIANAETAYGGKRV